MKQPVHTKKKEPNPEDVLTDNLRKAEDALIAALEALSGPSGPQRRSGYQEKLERAQEAVTGLYREELVRMRGPLKPPKARKGK